MPPTNAPGIAPSLLIEEPIAAPAPAPANALLTVGSFAYLFITLLADAILLPGFELTNASTVSIAGLINIPPKVNASLPNSIAFSGVLLRALLQL